MKWLIYNFLFAIAYVLMMPKFLFRMCRRGGYVNRFADRFGRYPEAIRARLNDGRKRVWVHAVSVGEVAVAGQLMAEMRRQAPGVAFVLSVTSSTGWTQAQAQVQAEDVLIYGPLDYPGCVRRALNAIRPAAYVITETELWPNVIRLAAARGVPIYLVNARISDRSAPGYRRLKSWFGPVLNRLTRIYAQSELDAQRLVEAGCERGRIEVSGSMKFDVARRNPAKEAELRAYLAAAGFDPAAPILLGGSTWPGEDAFLLEVYRRARTEVPALRLILAPRHFEKAGEVERNIAAAGFPCLRKSRVPQPTAQPAETVLLADTTGELMGFYGLSQVVFVGKSLCEHGAQNMIEPCLCGCAVAIGPNTENFRPVMSDLLDQQALVQAPDREALAEALLRLIRSEADRRALGARATAAVERRRGVTPRLASEILRALTCEE
ncbi:MAG: 3-deoxy-D-manno-octulosonic acid transferase [Lentisphaeraceae bacterium]|nr:3-deoxy-D-manno-octulosonic acid transferase [Lentisphaeraceae bacterium]